MLRNDELNRRVNLFYKNILENHILSILLILFIFKYTKKNIFSWYYHRINLDENSSSLLLNIFEPINSSTIIGSYAGMIGLFFSIVYLFFYKKISWKKSIKNTKLKVFILILVTFLTWKYAVYEYNYYLDTFHLFDRLFLIFLAFLVFFNPVFIPIFLICVTLMASQMNFPLGGYSLTDEKPFWDMLIIVCIFCFIKCFFKGLRPKHLIFLMIIIHASNYFYPGVTKITISPNGYEWVMNHNLHNYFYNAHDRGWLLFLSEDQILRLANFFSNFNFIGNLSSTIIQLLSIIILYNKMFLILLLILFELLHISILLVTGINFYKWIILNLALIWLVKNLDFETEKFLYKNRIIKIFSIILILLAPQYLKPVWLGWYMTDSVSRMHFQIETVSNNTYDLMPNDFAPYQKIFAFQRFHEILPKNIKILNIGVGGSPISSKVFKNLNIDNLWEFNEVLNQSNINDIDRLIEKNGVTVYNKRFDRKFDEFIEIYIKNLNTYISKYGARNRHPFLPFSHIYSRVKNNFKFDEKITKLKITFKKSYIEDKKIIVYKTYDVKEYIFN